MQNNKPNFSKCNNSSFCAKIIFIVFMIIIMIIRPVSFFNIQNPIIPHAIRSIGFSSNPQMNVLQSDRVELSFCGIFESSTEHVDLEHAQEYSGIHCPACGVQMFSRKDCMELVEKSKTCTNAQDLANLIMENKKFIPNNYKDIIEDIESIESIEDMTIPQFRKYIACRAYKRKRKNIHEAESYLKKFSKSFPEEKQKEAKSVLSEIHTRQSYATQKDKIEKFLKVLETPYEQERIAKANTLKKVLITDSYYRIFEPANIKKIPESDFSRLIVYRLFNPSVCHENKISKYPNHENLPNNRVLICGSCSNNQSKTVFWTKEDNYNLKENMKLYLTDMAYLMGTGKIEESRSYIGAFCAAAGKLSKYNLCFTNEEIASMRNLKRVVARHEEFAPIEQTKYDIPCADCGSIMLPHSKRKEIERELKQCSNPYEYSLVLLKNKKYIGVRSKVLADIFLTIVNNNPEINNEEFVKIYKEREQDYYNKSIIGVYKNYLRHKEYYSNIFTPEQADAYDKFGKRFITYFKEGKFEDGMLKPMYEACLYDLDLEKHPVKPIFSLLRDVKNISYRHQIAKSNNEGIFPDKDGVYTILFNLFKFNVATADHLVANNKGGEKSKDNLIGLCKCCNTAKAQVAPNNWYTDNKKVGENLKKQMLIIDRMAKNGDIEGYDDWAKDISQKLYELTYGRLDLRKDFE